MSLKIGDQVFLWVADTYKGKRLYLDEEKPSVPITKTAFEVIAINPISPGAVENLVMIHIPEELLGWTVSAFHVKYMDVPAKFLNQKYYELGEYFFNRKSPAES